MKRLAILCGVVWILALCPVHAAYTAADLEPDLPSFNDDGLGKIGRASCRERV